MLDSDQRADVLRLIEEKRPTGCGVFLLAIIFSTMITVRIVCDVVIPGLVCPTQQTQRCKEFRASYKGEIWTRWVDHYTKQEGKK